MYNSIGYSSVRSLEDQDVWWDDIIMAFVRLVSPLSVSESETGPIQTCIPVALRPAVMCTHSHTHTQAYIDARGSVPEKLLSIYELPAY